MPFDSGRWSVQSGVPTPERGNDQPYPVCYALTPPPTKRIIHPMPQTRQHWIGLQEQRRTNADRRFFYVRRNTATLLWVGCAGQRELRRFQFPVRQLQRNTTTMSTTASINSALDELNHAIETLSRLPESDAAATAARQFSTAARAFLRAALDATATPADVARPAAPATPMCKTAGYPFFLCNLQKDRLFCVREGIPLEGALEQASLFLESAQAIAGVAEEVVPEAIYGAGYLIEMARAVVDAAVSAIHAEDMAGAQ